MAKSSASFGNPILPGCEPRLLIPFEGKTGTLAVRPVHEIETHALFFAHERGELILAMHPNGYSVHELATRIQQAWASGDASRALAQYHYILDCGGTAKKESYILWACGVDQESTQKS